MFSYSEECLTFLDRGGMSCCGTHGQMVNNIFTFKIIRQKLEGFSVLA